MGLLDFITDRGRRREIAAALLAVVEEPYDRFHNELICDVALPLYGEAFSISWMKFIRCRIDTPLELNNFPADKLDMLADIATRQSMAVGPVFGEIREAMGLVLCNWRRRGVIRDSARFCLNKLESWESLGDPQDDEDPFRRTLIFFDIDLACSEVDGELAKLLDLPPRQPEPEKMSRNLAATRYGAPGLQ